MQAAGDLVAGTAELAARVQHRHADLDRRAVELWMLVHGKAAAVVPHGDRPVRVNDHPDMVAEACQGLVDGVVHNFINQVVQAAHVGGTDVHAGALADRLEPFEHLNLGSVVCFAGHCRIDQLIFLSHE